MRSTAPAEGEYIESCPPRGRFRSLHVGAGRGATLWDEEEDVCWLVGYHGFHQNGHPDDAYAVFGKIHSDGRLAPTVEDVLLLSEAAPEELLERLKGVAPALLEEARAHPGVEAVRSWQPYRQPENDLGEASMLVDLVIEDDGSAEQGWLGVTFPKDVPWPRGGAFAIVAALLPPDVEPTPTDTVGPRPVRNGELAYTWAAYH